MAKKRFNIIDVGIIVFILLVGILAFTRTSTEVQSFTFDAQDFGRIVRKYSELDQDGFVVNARVIGFDARTGEDITVDGMVTWSSSAMLVIQSEGRNISVGGPAARLEDVNATIVILEAVNETAVKNITLAPMRISSLEQLIPQEAGNNFKLHTQISVAETEPLKLQEVINALRSKLRYVSVYPLSVKNTINIEGAGREDLQIAADILGEIDGLSGIVTVRVYNNGEQF